MIENVVLHALAKLAKELAYPDDKLIFDRVVKLSNPSTY